MLHESTTSLGSLDVELLAAVLEFIDDTSPWTTKSLALVNKRFNAVTTLVRHRYKKLTICDSETINTWLEDSQLLRGLRHLEVLGPEPHQTRRQPNAGSDIELTPGCDLLALLIEKTGNLRSLSWSYKGALPLRVLNALHKYHPKAELKIFNFTREHENLDHTNPAEIALARSPSLTFLRAVIWRPVS